MKSEQITQNLLDAGCDGASAGAIARMFESENADGTLHQMKRIRCGLMEELHESGRKVDRLDFLIRSIERETKQAGNQNMEGKQI